MKTKINGKDVDVEVTKKTNRFEDAEVAFSVRINGFFVVEITKAGKLRRCAFAVSKDNGLQASRTGCGRIKLEKGY